jgi:hypothetical protein
MFWVGINKKKYNIKKGYSLTGYYLPNRGKKNIPVALKEASCSNRL